MNYVVIGNSSAAIAGVEAIREIDSLGTITMISDEPQKAYSRPIISYLLAGKAKEKKIWYRNKDFYESHNVELISNKKVSSINPGKKKVILEDHQEISFDKLLITTGGTPFVPDIKGLKQYSDRVFTFTKWSDANELIAIKNALKKVVVIGAGMIGTKATEAFTELGVKVTLVELADCVLCKSLDKDASMIVQRRMEEKGVTVVVNNEVKELAGEQGTVDCVVLRDGTQVSCDAVIVAIGVVPNTEIVNNTSIKINRGIVVNEQMETSVKDVYAAGDVCEAGNVITGGKMSIPIWPLATRGGAIAGKNMASDLNISYADGYPMNAIEFCGVSTISFGVTDGAEDNYEILTRTDAEKSVYKKIILQGNRIVGAIFVGDVERAGIINNLTKEGYDISEIKHDLLSDDFGYISFSRDFRRVRLEQVV